MDKLVVLAYDLGSGADYSNDNRVQRPAWICHRGWSV